MNRYQIKSSINGANNAIGQIRQAINHIGQESGFLRDASVEIQNGYKGASSAGINEKITSYSRETSNQSNEMSNEIRSIQSIVSDLQYLDRQLEEQERREREARERAAREAREKAGGLGYGR